jgi:hypothetical protein
MESKGVIFFNRGEKMIVRAIVALYSLRKHYDGEITFFLEDPYPKEFENVCKFFNVNVVINETNHEVKTLTRKNQTLLNSPYDKTLWLDSDTVTVGPVDEMFDYLDEYNVAIPHFAGWVSTGRTISKRIKQYEGIADQKHIDKALEKNPAINTGIFSYKKCQFLKEWVELSEKADGKFFISDEIAFQVLYPSYPDVKIAPMKFNVSVKHDPNTLDKRVVHFHGQKHCLDFKNSNYWKNEFEEMRKDNIANINYFVDKYPDKRLKQYLNNKKYPNSDITIVTACDEKYVEFLKLTYPNWVKYKKINEYPMIVFVNGMKPNDSRLDFLDRSHVKIIPWKMENADNHREEMLSAFVFGTAEHVNTDYWLKIDADSYAINYKPLITEDMKEYAFCGHKWGYSRPEHIKKLDEWAKNHWRPKLKNAKPMINEGRIEGRRFYHNTKRTISFIQLHKTKFTRFCVKLLKEKKLPAPTQDTFMFYVCNRFDPQFVGVKNFKRHHGFTQGNSRRGVEELKKGIDKVEEENKNKKSSNLPLKKFIK